MSYELKNLHQKKQQELHRDRISQVYLGEVSDTETQRRAQKRIDWTVENINPDKIFDIGCSEGILAIQLARNSYQVDAIDIHPEVLSYAESLAKKLIPDFSDNINFKLQNIFEISDIEPIYDTVVLGEVIEHVFEPGNLLKRAVLALKKNGRIIVTTPFGYSPAPDHHQTFFLSNFLEIIPTVLRCDEISIVDGYIRFIGTKIMDTGGEQKVPEKLKATNSIAARELLSATEQGAFDSQKHLRTVFENRNTLLEQARENSVKLKKERDDLHQKVLAEKKSTALQLAEKKKLLADRSALLEQARENSVKLKKERDDLHQKADEALDLVVTSNRKQEEKYNILFELSRQLYVSHSAEIKKLATAKNSPVETRNVDQIQQPIPGSRKIKKRKLASAAEFLARNSYIRSFVRRVVPPTIKRRITSKINNTPMVAPPAGPAIVKRHIPTPSYTALLPDTFEYDLILLCNSYPGGAREYGGEFVQSRAESYASNNHSTLIVEVSSLNKEPTFGKAGSLSCLRIPIADLGYFLKKFKNTTSKVLTHSPTPETLKIVSEMIDSNRCFHWFHGFEVRDYRRLFFNYSTAELESQRGKLDAINLERMAVAKSCFADKVSNKIFVSNYIKSVAENDIGQVAENEFVIPNFIDGAHYQFQQKTPQDARRILLIRTFQNRNYANDIAINAIKLLSGRPGFDELQFTIRGFGPLFEPLTKPLESLPNVDVRIGHLNAVEMQQLHSEHGIFLVPSRFDTQGVTMGEAMASGLVCVTNNTTAIPEYADQNCTCLVRPDDPKAYAEAIWNLHQNPDKLPQMSKAAAERVRRQCGFDQTIEKELDLLSK